MTIGRLAPQKGLEDLLDASPAISQRATIAVVGEGPLRDALEEQARTLGVCDRVRFMGFSSDIGLLLRAADVIALPSLWEGLSISLLEAMAAGKPIVTTSIGSNLEASEEGACAKLVAPKRPADLARAINEMLSDPVRSAELGRNAQRRFSLLYGNQRMLTAYLELYRNPLGYGLP
jgi:glycosyltransferase involved in cell wall biosynthesis